MAKFCRFLQFFKVMMIGNSKNHTHHKPRNISMTMNGGMGGGISPSDNFIYRLEGENTQKFVVWMDGWNMNVHGRMLANKGNTTTADKKLDGCFLGAEGLGELKREQNSSVKHFWRGESRHFSTGYMPIGGRGAKNLKIRCRTWMSAVWHTFFADFCGHW